MRILCKHFAVEIGFSFGELSFTVYSPGEEFDGGFGLYLLFFYFYFTFLNLIPSKARSKSYNKAKTKAEVLSKERKRKVYPYQVMFFQKRLTGFRVNLEKVDFYIYNNDDWSSDDWKHLPWNGNGWCVCYYWPVFFNWQRKLFW